MLRLNLNKKDGNLISNYRIPVTPEIFLGGYHEDDLSKLVEYLNDLTIYNNTLNIPHPYTAEDANWWIDHISKEARKLGYQPNWTIRHKVSGMIGGIGMVVHGDDIASKQEIGYWLAKPFRRQGIMTEVIKTFCNYCFNNHKVIQCISAHIFVKNEASQATIKKAEFEMTRLIDNYYKKGDQLISAYEFIRYRN